ncbi:MAG: EamA family transporter, partial [Desulfobacterium sp.]
FFYNILFFEGLRHIHAGRAALIIAMNPIVISLLSALLFKEKLNFIRGLGIILSVTGALVVISNGQLTGIVGYHMGKGELLLFGCVASWVSYSLIGKLIMGSLSPLVSVCYSSLAGTALLAVPFLINGQFHEIITYTLLDWCNLFYLGLFGTVLGFFWYYEGINTIGPMKASVFINVVPVSAIILSYFILDEAITPSLFSGGVLVIFGVYATNASDMVRTTLTRLTHGLRVK